MRRGFILKPLAEEDDGARHSLRTLPSYSKMYYDHQFYEFRALQQVAKKLKTPVKINYRIPDFNLPYSKRNELDGYIEKKDLAIEVKSYPLGSGEASQISNKLLRLGYKRQMIVAPRIEKEAQGRYVKFLEFNPDMSNLSVNWSGLENNLPESLARELATGKHNFRYRAAIRAKNRRSRYLNQVDKRISNSTKLMRDVNRLFGETHPIKILWSTKRWFSPKDNFYREVSNTCLGGSLVFDIDGLGIHRAMTPCEISPESGLCPMCLFFSKRETAKLVGFLKHLGFRKIEAFFSGRSGFHVYAFDNNRVGLETIRQGLMERKIKTDLPVTFGSKTEIAFPLTINGFSGYPLEYVESIDKFEL